MEHPSSSLRVAGWIIEPELSPSLLIYFINSTIPALKIFVKGLARKNKSAYNRCMRRRENFFLTFFIFFFLTTVLFFGERAGVLRGVREGLESVFSSVSVVRSLGSLFGKAAPPKLKELEEENTSLRRKLVDQTELLRENKALRDQFETAFPKSYSLLPAKVIGSPGEYLIIDKGAADNVKNGLAVVFKDMVVGRVIKVSSRFSLIEVVGSKTFSLTGKTLETGALGTVKGEGNGDVIFENVILSEKLLAGDTVVTKGDINEEGAGFPPDLIIGKIEAIEKRPSALFQAAKIKSMLDFPRLTVVFILMQ